MEWPTHSSMIVAPLQISKSMSRTASIMTERTQTKSSSADSARGAQHPGQLTPPLTPHNPEAGFEMHRDFQTYLRAFYPYHPSCDDSSSTVTLPLNAGDVILVHSVHTNGWADGTLLTSGARGWLPTNYCEGYDSEPLRPLMKALTIFWDLVKGSNVGGLSVFHNSDYVKGLVGGVRLLLVSDPLQSLSFPTLKRLTIPADKHQLPQQRIWSRSISQFVAQTSKSAPLRSRLVCQNYQRPRESHGQLIRKFGYCN